jgi:phosphatidylinositol 4-kinase
VETKQEILTAHTRFLIKYASHRDESVREIADSLLSQLRNKFPQVRVCSNLCSSLIACLVIATSALSI